ncbi:hypothetical protein [uncultured Porticoccus sp.]|uniref:hypothetical protein n=1 Tax=uncultured Porticoccus sp. TaxID=1256050 RepID=UPI00260E1BD7|nr:hypothetical protein [uncultured Porticoccus sp.]
MDKPDIKRGDWIILKPSEDAEGIEALVYNVREDGSLFVGYHQHSFKTIKAKAVWAETYWQVV